MKKIFSLLLVMLSLVVITACGKEDNGSKEEREKAIKTLVMYSGSSSYSYEYTYDYEKNILTYDVFEAGDSDSVVLNDVDLDTKLNDKIKNYTLVDELNNDCEEKDGCHNSYILIEYEDGSKKYVSDTKTMQELEPIFSELLENNNTDASVLYELEYFDDGIPGNNYNIYFFNDKSIKVVHKPGCSTTECLSGEVTMKENTYIISFSKEGMEVVWNWAHQFFQGEATKQLTLNDLSEDDQIIVWSLTYNDEMFLWEK